MLCSGISDAISGHAGPWCKRVWARTVAACNLVDLKSANNERIRDQRTMTPPGHGLRAHDCRPPAACQTNQLPEGSIELRSLHVVGKAAETRVSPSCIDRVAPCMSQTAKGRHMDVLNPGSVKGHWQLILVELRVVPRARDGPYIDQPLNAVSLKKSDEVIQGPCRVAHRPKRDAAAVSF